MSLKNLTKGQLMEDFAIGSYEERDAIREEFSRRADEREERMARAEDARDER